jgi:ubiquinone/menaquinone biosynthesis C-methylase UbiE
MGKGTVGKRPVNDLAEGSAGERLTSEMRHYDELMAEEGYESYVESPWSRIVLDRWTTYVDENEIKGNSILDICCGDGRVVKYATRFDTRLAAGVDLSIESLRLGRRTEQFSLLGSRVSAKDDISLLKASAEVLPFRADSFDVVFLIRAFHHIMDKTALLSSIQRVLKPGGLVFVLEPRGDHPLRILADKVGRRSGVLTPDEQVVDESELVSQFEQHHMYSARTFRFSLVSEIIHQSSRIFQARLPRLGAAIRRVNVFMMPAERVAERMLIGRFKQLAWMSLFVFRNS